MKKFILLIISCSLFFNGVFAFTSDETLREPDSSIEDGLERVEERETFHSLGVIPDQKTSLGKKIADGTITLNDIPYFIIHLINICTIIAGSVCVIFLMYGGFQLITSGVTENREGPKNTIKYAITGLIVCFMAWVIVNLVQVQLTG